MRSKELKNEFETILKKLEKNRDYDINNEKQLLVISEEFEKLTGKINESIIHEGDKELFSLLKIRIYEARMKIHIKIQRENKKIVRKRKKFIKLLEGKS